MAEGSWSAFLYDAFPLTRGMTLLRQSVIPEQSGLTLETLLGFAAICLTFTFVGYWLFRWMEKKARMQALLSQY